MTHSISHRDLALGKNNFDSSKSFFGFYLVIPMVNKRVAVRTDQFGPEIVGADRNNGYLITEILLLGKRFEQSTKNLQASFGPFWHVGPSL